MPPRDEQREKRYMEILAAALDLFTRKGYAATKIADIAAQVNMSVGLLFHYFPSKEKLYETLVEQGLQGTKMAMEHVPQSGSAMDIFIGAAYGIFGAIRETPQVAQMFLLMATAIQSSATPPHIREMAIQVSNIEDSVDIIQRGQVEGSIRQGDPLALSSAFWCSLQGIAEQLACRPEMPVPDPEWILDILRAKQEENTL